MAKKNFVNDYLQPIVIPVLIGILIRTSIVCALPGLHKKAVQGFPDGS